MRRVPPPAEPPTFDRQCRQKGAVALTAWRLAGKTGRPRDLWSPFREQLRDGFEGRCGYTAMLCSGGSVDHFVSIKTNPALAYEWSNYRFIEEWVNKSKQNLDGAVLDPFEVHDDWFELLLPSLQLVLTSRVPAKHRARAQRTIERLHLRDDERIIRQRASWLAEYEARRITLEGLDRYAPLLAAAIRKRDAGRGARGQRVATPGARKRARS